MDTDELFNVFTEDENSSNSILLNTDAIKNSEILKKKRNTENEDSSDSSNESEIQSKKRKTNDLSPDSGEDNNSKENELQLTDFFVETDDNQENKNSSRSVCILFWKEHFNIYSGLILKIFYDCYY